MIYKVVPQVYAGYGEMHGGDLGDSLCKPGTPCQGPSPDRIMEGNTYFDSDFPLMTKVLSARYLGAQVKSVSGGMSKIITWKKKE